MDPDFAHLQCCSEGLPMQHPQRPHRAGYHHRRSLLRVKQRQLAERCDLARLAGVRVHVLRLSACVL
jgi:hypothetical protein